MNSKKKIQDQGKLFNYLQDPELRRREAGEKPVIIKNTLISGVNFTDLNWNNLHFINCDFLGAYEIQLEELRNSIFEDCNFAGIISWGVAHSIRYVRCRAGGRTIVIDEVGSTDIRFEDCAFLGTDADRNHWGGMGSRGDATFVRCRMKWFSLAGYKQINIEGCETADVKIWTDSEANSGKDYFSSSVKIESSKLRGKFDMAACDLQSVTIKDTYVDSLDLSGAEIKNDVLIERVKGGYLNLYPQQADSLIVRNSQILGNDQKIFEAYAGGIKKIEIESVVFGGGALSGSVIVAGGTGMNLANPRPRINQSISIKDCSIPNLNTHHINTSSLLLKGCKLENVAISSSFIDKLELTGNTITRAVDFSNTNTKEHHIQPLPKNSTKLDGSNIRLN